MWPLRALDLITPTPDRSSPTAACRRTPRSGAAGGRPRRSHTLVLRGTVRAPAPSRTVSFPSLRFTKLLPSPPRGVPLLLSPWQVQTLTKCLPTSQILTFNKPRRGLPWLLPGAHFTDAGQWRASPRGLERRRRDRAGQPRALLRAPGCTVHSSSPLLPALAEQSRPSAGAAPSVQGAICHLAPPELLLPSPQPPTLPNDGPPSGRAQRPSATARC